MQFRVIGLIATAMVVLLAIADVAMVRHLSEERSFWYYAIARLVLLLLVALCAGAAAHSSGWWREYFGRVWSLFFLGYIFIAVTDLSKRFLEQAGEDVFRIVANLSLIGAYWLMARSLHSAGLSYHGSRVKQVAFIILIVILAVGLVHDSILTEARGVLAGTSSVSHLVSAFADLIAFILVAPLLLTAFALRGGELYWQFAFVTIGTFGWMLNQGARRLLELVSREDLIATGRMIGFAIACFFIAAAALTHYMSVRRSSARGDGGA